MKLFIISILLFFNFYAFANTAFEIPRSTVIDLVEPSTNRIYPLFIKLPRSYNSSPTKHYPVIYLTDAWYSFQVVSGATRFPMNSGAMSEAIIVGISYSKSSKGVSSRVRDYTPSKAEDWKMESGNAAGHANFISNVVFPFIDNKYRTKSSQRTFIGNSLGGLFGAYILFSHPEMFNSYILGSPSVWFNKNYILSTTVTKINSPIKVYISVGSMEKPLFGEQEDMVLGAKKLALKIKDMGDNNLTLKFSIIEGATHAIAFPTTSIQGLYWLYSQK